MTNREGNTTMSTWKSALLAGTIALAPIAAPAAFAATQEAPEAEAVAYDAEADTAAMSETSKARMQREMDEAMAFVEKLFDTSHLPPIDPARLELSRTTTAALIPSGSVEKMIDNMYGRMFSTFMEEVGGTSDLMLSIKTGVETDKIAALDDKTKAQVADIFDPQRKAREGQINKIIRPLISEALADLEPPMREGLAKAYARKFSGEQLGEVNAFFATPTGKLYANESLALQADPEVMLATIKAVPPLVTKFIDRAPTIEKQLGDLPKEKSLGDLSDAEINKLAKLMKVDAKTLKETRDMWASSAADDAAYDSAGDAVDAADAAAYATDAAADVAGADEGYNRENWSAADIAQVEKAEADAAAATSALFEAEAKAAANARKKLGLPDPTD